VKTLVVLTQPPAPEGGAPGRCAVALLRGLQEHGVEVAALAARQQFSQPDEPPADLPVEVVAVAPEPRRWRTRFNRLRRPRGELGRGEFAERVREAAGGADVLHLEETETAWCDEGLGLPSLVHVHFLVRRDRSWGAPWQKGFRDVLELALAERAAVRRHRYLVASSSVVADALRAAAPKAEVVLAPLALDPRYYRPAPLDGPPTAGIIGTALWPPTAEAIRRLVTRVWPHVQRRQPDARLLVAGRGTRALAGLEGIPGVEVVGEVDAAPEFFSRLSVLLYPLERGSGMKVKTLEAIATGVPVVTTASGAEGIAPNDGVVTSSEDEALASAAAAILEDEAERRHRGAAARATFERDHTPLPATAPLVDLYARMAAGR
jgi:glycosyltransferase involved in cell wall biosynthesis